MIKVSFKFRQTDLVKFKELILGLMIQKDLTNLTQIGKKLESFS